MKPEQMEIERLRREVSKLKAERDILKNESIEDGLIAASAITHNLIVVTRSVKDFAKFRIKTVNPFEASPEK
jgi:predicted nucleic acid-binding protein